MRNIIKLFIIFSFFTLVSCKSPKCLNSEQYTLSSKYLNVLKSEYNGGGVLVGEALNANLMLSEITGIKSKASYGDISTYLSTNDYKNDIKSWINWINNESCLIDIQLLKRKETKLLNDLK